MHILFKATLVTLLSLSIISCDGFDFDSDSISGSNSPDEIFTRSELANNILFSATILNETGFNNRDGFILLFESTSNLKQIALRNNDNDDALEGDYEWTIVNDDLQVTYPNAVVCTSTKNSQTGLQLTASSNCDGGEPNNDRIRSTLNKPTSFSDDNISPSTIIIENDDNDQSIDFYSTGNYEIRDIDINGNEINQIIESGTYTSDISTALYSNVVRLNETFPTSDGYTLLVLLNGSLSSGTMLQLRYEGTTPSTDTLTEVRIYNIKENERWEVDSLYNDISIDN
ncbi:MAG: hypothetical protein ACI88H_001221 [Cocleimonas sp.]|jgi:hypothetical protein